MGLTESRVCVPLKIQPENLKEKKSSWSYLMPLFSIAMGNCLDWPLRAVRHLLCFLFYFIFLRTFDGFCGTLETGNK